MNGAGRELRVCIVTPEGIAAELVGDSVRLPLAGGPDGEDGGSMGVRPGHIQALIVLGKGRALVFKDGAPLLAADLETGMASVLHDRVTIVSDSLNIHNDTENGSSRQ